MTRTWDDELAELEARRTAALGQGGADLVAKEHAKGRYTARERLDMLLDPNTFQEVGMLAMMDNANGRLPSGLICGFGKVGGRQIAVAAEDYTIAMGTWTGLYLSQSKGIFPGFIEDLAYRWKVPLVVFLQGIGGDVDSGTGDGGNIFPSALSLFPVVELLSLVPMVTAVMGPTAGGSAGRAVCAHFSLMSRENGFLFAAGPPIVKHALGQTVSKHDLGGYKLHTEQSGAIDNAFDSEEEAVDKIKRFLSYLPSNVHEQPPRKEVSDDDPTDRSCDRTLKIVSPDKPRRIFDPRALIKDIFDRDSFFEIGPGWAKSIVTGLARIGGISVGVLAHHSQHQGGALTPEAADKQVRFVEMCDTFHVPIIYLVDTPGVMIGEEAERAGILRRAVRALTALHRATVPVVTLHVRRSFGLATMASGNPNQLSIKLAWPTATQGAMGLPIDAAASVLYKEEIAKAEDPEAFLADVIERLRAKVSVWTSAEQFNMEDVIDPRETRKTLYRWIEAATSGRRPETKHGPQYRP